MPARFFPLSVVPRANRRDGRRFESGLPEVRPISGRKTGTIRKTIDRFHLADARYSRAGEPTASRLRQESAATGSRWSLAATSLLTAPSPSRP